MRSLLIALRARWLHRLLLLGGVPGLILLLEMLLESYLIKLRLSRQKLGCLLTMVELGLLLHVIRRNLDVVLVVELAVDHVGARLVHLHTYLRRGLSLEKPLHILVCGFLWSSLRNTSLSLFIARAVSS